MKTFLKAAIAATMLAGVTSTAHAQVNIVGTTSGCFYSVAYTCLANPYNGLTFTGGSFSVTPANPGGEYQLNDFDDFLGTFVLAPNTNFNFGDPLRFRLSITFTSPSSASPNPGFFVADFDGDVLVNGDNDKLDIDFNNNYMSIDYTGTGYSQFRINVNDLSNLERDDSNGQRLTGKIKCWEQGDDDDGDINTCKPTSEASVVTTTVTTPEPSTYALMAAGLAAVGFVGRRRRSNS